MKCQHSQWQRQFVASSPNRRFLHHHRLTSDGRRKRSFVRHEKDDGTYYTIASKAEGKDMPRQIRPEELFQLSNLILDLDAVGADKVREFGPGDRQKLEAAYAMSQKRRSVRETLQRFNDQINQSRNATHQMISRPLNPWRITGYDVLSVALRGYKGGDKTQSSEIEGEALGYPKIYAITQAHCQPDMHTSRVSLNIDQATCSKSQGLLSKADSRQGNDCIETLRSHNGIPYHSTKNEKHLLRWLVARREQCDNSMRAKKGSIATIFDFLETLQSQESISGVRRLVFQYFNTEDLRLFALDAETSQNSQSLDQVAAEIFGATARILQDLNSDASYVEALVFANNLAERCRKTPILYSSMAGCIKALQAQCLQNLGLPDGPDPHLSQDMSVHGPEMLSSVSNAVESSSLPLASQG